MLKKNLFVLFMLITGFLAIYAQADSTTDDTSSASSPVTPFFGFTNTATMTVHESVDSFENEVEDMTLGLNAVINDKLTISPYICNTFDFAVNSDSSANMKFGSDALEFGVGFSVSPAEVVSIGFGVSNNYEFIPGEHVWFGTNGMLSLGINVESVHFSLSFEDNLNPMFQKFDAATVNTILSNELCTELNFNFFNFIKDDLNSGLWVSNTLTSTGDYSNSSINKTDFENELYAGFMFNPFAFFDCKASFYSLHNWGYDNTNKLTDDKSYEIGLFVGTTIYYNAVSLNISYTPVFYSAVNDKVNDTMVHYISASITVGL